MAYASKYYDPQKAHEYYMKTRKLKGYENRYGGARGDGTSAASGMKKSNNSGNSTSSITRRTNSSSRSSGSSISRIISKTDNSSKYVPGETRVSSMQTLSGATINSSYIIRESTNDPELDELVRNYDKLKSGLKAVREEHKSNISHLRDDMRKSSSREDKASFKEAISYNNSLHKQDVDKIKDDIKKAKEAIKARREAIKARREAIKREKKAQKQKEKAQKQKDIEASAYIKDRMNAERDETIKKVNKSVDNDMLSEAQRIVNNLKKRRQNGERIDNKVLLSQLRALSGRAKKSKIKYKKKYVKEYKTRYKEEMDRYYNSK